MPTIRQQVEHPRVTAGRIAVMPMKPARVETPSLRIVKTHMSAIEYIVENARSGEVVHIDDGDYHNDYLWRSYDDF
ncbi:MAG: hypothetical protein V7696_20200 [Halioglobus sp.]